MMLKLKQENSRTSTVGDSPQNLAEVTAGGNSRKPLRNSELSQGGQVSRRVGGSQNPEADLLSDGL
ncbi:hypothetical protein TSAR_005105 [Trichomalopsis sarcophagae]|uniref:Uncharacterized protein n=1 Tax=Trichomalopsis sarcophagae TaxID=543379 RepID=A0A232FLH0_9HYME|nr:hypothetical protein TSAR_005105 [Trichomalopsis sarcophagae]